MKEIDRLEPRAFTRFCMSIGAVPSSYIAGLTIEEQLLWFCSYLEKEVIPVVNNNAEAVTELQNLYVQLKDYVDNYFDNLDVQEEINNKLDDMAESGELADIIAEYLQLAGIFAYDTKADMKAAENLDEGSICKTLGNLTYSDGQGAFYRVREALNTDVIDDENIIALHDPELVAEKILYSSGYDLQQEINSINTKINNLEEYTKNSKYVAPLFLDNEYRQSTAYVREFLTNCVEAGFKESQMLVNIKSDGTLLQDETKFAEYDSIATSLGIPITSIKFHGSYSYTDYLANVVSIIGDFANIKTCFIFNEQLDECLAHGLTYPATIKATYPNIKVGFTVQYNLLYQATLTSANWASLLGAYDIIGLHLYPSCSSYTDSKNCSFDKVLEAFNSPENMIPWTKEMWITESGVLPYWQFLELPEGYDLSLLTDTTRTTEPQAIFYKALSKCNLAQKVKKICPWFLESGMSGENNNLFSEILKNAILDR